MQKQSTTRNSIILGLAFIILFIIADLLLARVFISYSDKTFRTSHYYYHHGLVPNQKAIAQWYNISYPLYTNSLGFRDSEIRDIALKTHKRRILIMGDSHSEGVGLPFEDTFTGQLIKMTDNSETEILNASAVSYSPRIYYLKTRYLIEEVGLEFDELVVLIDLSDLQNEIVYEGFEPQRYNRRQKTWFNFTRAAFNRSFTFHTINNIRQARQTNRFIKKSELFDEYRKEDAHVDALNLYASFFSGFDDKTMLSNPLFHGVGLWMYDNDFVELAKKGLETGGENMAKLAALCLKHGIPMTITVHPWPQQIQRGDAEDLYVTYWKEFAEEHELGFINFYPLFIDPPVSAALGIEFFIPGDNHWNKNGNWVVAQKLNELLQSK